jgi:dienelactone hydrolase
MIASLQPALKTCLAAIVVLPAFASARVVEEVYQVPVSVIDAFDQRVSHELVVTILRETTVEHAPILVLSHGRGPDRVTMPRARFPGTAEFFVEQGYLVVMPTRIGYGPTGGPDVETRGRDCMHAEFSHGFDTAADETQQVLDWVAKRSDVDASRIVAVGQSYGGATTLALAAHNPRGLIAAINFSGGGGGDKDRNPERPCRPDRVGSAYETYGQTTRVPELWLYSENDKLWGPDIPKRWFDRYHLAGAPAEFFEMPPVGDNGHTLLARGADLWRPLVLRFLAEHATVAAEPSSPQGE